MTNRSSKRNRRLVRRGAVPLLGATACTSHGSSAPASSSRATYDAKGRLAQAVVVLTPNVTVTVAAGAPTADELLQALDDAAQKLADAVAG